MQLRYFLFLTPILIALSLPTRTLAAPSCNIIKSLLEEVSQVRGLRAESSVRCKVENKDEVRAFLERAIKERVGDELFAAEEKIYKALGLIPASYPYREGIKSLYLSQIAGYYDPKAKGYVMASWLPDEQQTPVAAHELTHALQDQHFNLGALTDSHKLTSDEQYARAALIEGDATAVMMDHMLHSATKKLGESGLGIGLQLGSMPTLGPVAEQMQSMVISTEDLKAAPPALVDMMIFPYSQGLQFVHGLLRAGGYQRVSEAFTKLPRSSWEVMDVERYLNGEYNKAPDFPEDAAAASTSKVRRSDVLGALTLFLALRELGVPTATARSISDTWTGDRMTLFTDDKVVWRIYLSSPAAAQDAFLALCANDNRVGASADETSLPTKRCEKDASFFRRTFTLSGAGLTWEMSKIG